MSFAAKISRNGSLIYELRSCNPLGPVYFILKVTKHSHEAFKRMLSDEAGGQDETVDLTRYGEVLHKGYGEPPDTLKAQLREQYGMYQDE